MKVKQIKVGTMDNFVYLAIDDASKDAIVIDSGWEIQPILSVAEKEGARIRFIIATHHHFDHTMTIGELAEMTNSKIITYEGSEIRHDIGVRDNSMIRIGGSEVKIIHTPGHTMDSICIYDGSNLFTGDTLFIGSWGRTDLPDSSIEELYHSLHDKIMKLPGSTVIYPGHDYGEVPYRALSDEAILNPALLAKDLNSFLSLISY